jgi:tetrahydromethanopterin S-methyltransferase subunit G
MTTEQAMDAIFRIIELVILPLLAFIAHKMNNLERKLGSTQSEVSKMNSEVSKINTVLIGPDGKNGLRSRLRRLEVKVDQLALQQAARHGEAPTLLIPDEDDS